ncbi:hypothetical protein C8R47DRAFT_1145737 [Mycena vitilis]|nr:hypothetical protein C8R47DRAFT_1145737 [Mycena vitilis]
MSSDQSSFDPPPPSSHFDDATVQHSDQRHRRGPFSLRAFLSKIIGPPGIVICGQIILQLIAWGFFAAIESRGFIPLPSVAGFPPAIWFEPLTYVFAWISTGLAFCSSYLFSWGVRQSITLHLQGEGMFLTTFLSTVQISSRSLIHDRHQLKWSVLSGAVFWLTGLQAAGWIKLLTPKVFPYNLNIVGRELDISSSILQPLGSSGALDYCVLNTSNLPAFTVGQTDSGYAALNADEGFLAPLNVIDQTFVTSTGGILPLSFHDVDAAEWFPNMTTTIPATLSPFFDVGTGLSSNLSTTQQGFTADVTCKFQNLTLNTIPSLKIEVGAPNASAPSLVQMSSNCAAPNGSAGPLNSVSAYTYLTDGSGYILMVACDGATDVGGYTLIFAGSGLYDFVQTTVCTLSPKVNRLQVDYSYDFSSALIAAGTPLPGTSIPDEEGSAGLSAVNTLSSMMYFAQTTQTNIVGDQLSTAILNLDGGDFDNAVILNSMEEYVRGVTEYSATIFRACLSGKDLVFSEGVPSNMSVASKGRLSAQVVGWGITYNMRGITTSTSWVLIPATLIAFATIYVVVKTVARHARDPVGEPFDPANTMQLLEAAAAGGLRGVFTGKDDEKAKENIAVGTIDGQGPAFIMRPSTERI